VAFGEMDFIRGACSGHNVLFVEQNGHFNHLVTCKKN
jgi:hypothetical protein